MKHLLTVFSILTLFAFIPGCATIFGGSNWPISVRTNPDGAKVEIRNKKGLEVYSGTSPATLRLKSGAGYFSKESYTISLSNAGYEPKTINLECKINGWYFGNILIGGVLGMLIIDPATGAMYKLDTKNIKENLSLVSTSFNGNDRSLLIMERDQIPPDAKKEIVLLK